MFDNYFVSTRGKKYECVPVSDTKIALALAAIEKRYRNEGRLIDKPKYRVDLAGGGEEWFTHDEKSVKGDPEAELVWNNYLYETQRLIDEQNNKKIRMLLRGIQWEENPDWQYNQEIDGITVPPKPVETDSVEVRIKKNEERWWHFLTTEILETPDDLFNAIEKMTLLTYAGAVSEEAIRAGINNFRSVLQQSSTATLDAANKE